ncbi:MAG TPA: aldehyde dehydrogenase family protein [Myxococcota bacterium]|jgi:acyl-CoA reductase-like NAD-dependent aldehyde dehydrogenase|nr:aldehyde dehydrogenase family protein [Myxococcota bacterium]
MSDFTMTIDGKGVAGAKTFGVINPATGAVFTQAPDCSKSQLDQAMEAANAAFKSWQRDEAKRRQVLLDCAEAIKKNTPELAKVLTQEQGKPLARAMEECIGAAVWLQVTAGLKIPVDLIQDGSPARVEVRRKPYGVVGAITPWNFPLLLAVWKIAPALLAGNTIVLKPSPFTPLSSLKLGEVLRDVVPAGVVNIVSGGDELGKWVSEHPIVRKISFTGSVATGKKIAISAAPDLKRVTLELGGNDAAIVLPDVDPAKAAEKLFWGAFTNSGQVCSAIKRLYVHESIYDKMVDAISAIAKGVKMGDGLAADTLLGPINNKPQFERVRELVEDAKRAGARIRTGGMVRSGGGYFYEPTIITGISDGVRLVDEEQFGPALPILPFRDVEDAIERANATHFGLSGSVWTNDVDKGRELVMRLDCGTGWVNQHLAIRPDAPFGGSKWSGVGYENGPYGLAAYTQLQTVNTAAL